MASYTAREYAEAVRWAELVIQWSPRAPIRRAIMIGCCPGRRFPAGGAGGAAKVDIENLEVIAGYLPRRALGLVLDWAELHQRELRDNWALAQQRKPLNDITPFE